MAFPKIRDNEDALVDRLGRLITVLENKEMGGTGEVNQTVNKTVNVTEPTEENTAEYFSTGEAPVLIDSESYTDPLPFGFVASTVHIRATDDIVVRFVKPSGQSTGKDIFVGGTESPFNIGGSNSIDTAFLWIRKASTATSDPTVRVIAYR